MAYKVIILYQLYMPSYFLGTFTEYPCIVGNQKLNSWYEKLGYEYVRTITDGEYQGNLREKKLQVSTT